MLSRRFALLAAVSFLAACGGARGPAPAIVVSGVIVDLFGNPAPGITVSVAEQSTVSDANGRFSLPNVSPPYGLTAVSVRANEAVVYEGLTRSDPTIQWRQSLSSFGRRGQILGTIDAGVPIDALTRTRIVFRAPEALAPPAFFPTTTTYGLSVMWNGAQTITGSVHALQVTTDVLGGLPTAFPGYGVRTDVPIFDGSNTPGVDLPLSPPSVGSIGGAFSLPAGYSFLGRSHSLGFADGASIPVGGDNGQELVFSYTLPSNIDATAIIDAQATGPGGVIVNRRETGIAVGTTGLVIALPQGAPIIGPTDGTTSVDGQTEFSWNAFPGGVFTVDFFGNQGAPSFHVVTRATRTTIPQIPSLPLPVVPTQYTWRLFAAAPFASMDEAAGPQDPNPAGNALLTSSTGILGFITR
jgi:hypothetical protein